MCFKRMPFEYRYTTCTSTVWWAKAAGYTVGGLGVMWLGLNALVGWVHSRIPTQ